MYLNFKLISEKGFNPLEILLLQCIKQNSTDDLSDFIVSLIQSDESLEKLKEQGYIKIIKGKKGQSEFERMRIDKKGKKLLEDAYTPEVTEGDVQLFDYLSEMYLKHEDEERHIGNKKKTKIYCAIFRQYLSLSLHQAYWLFYLFLETYSHTKRLEYIFFNSNKNRYGNFRSSIEDAPVYQFYEENKERIEKFWKNKEL